MAVIISVTKLLKGIDTIHSSTPIHVRLRDTTTAYRDKVTGWTLVGEQIKELPTVSPGHPNPTLIRAIRAGRFVRVVPPMYKNSQKKYEDLVNSVLKEYEAILKVDDTD